MCLLLTQVVRLVLDYSRLSISPSIHLHLLDVIDVNIDL